MSLKQGRDLFCGVMNEMKEHLVNPNRSQIAHLDDGYEDWLRFGFESLGVVEVSDFGDIVRLVLCASDTTSAQAGLSKYRKTWDLSVKYWFGCKVAVEWQQTVAVRRGRGG